MHAYISFALYCLTSFFTLINPLGVMPIFMTMTSDFDHSIRKITAKRAVLVSVITLLFFAFSGQLLFRFFGISVNSLKIVGGVIFFLMGQDMLQARLVKTQIADKEIKKYVHDISITPLAIPMICGPGAITNAIVLMENESTLHKIILVLSIIVIGLITYLILLNSSRIIKLLGDTGNNVLMRLMGLIVMVIAVEFFVSGATPIVRQMLNIH